MATAEVEEEVFGAGVVGENGLEDLRRVGGAESGVGEGIEPCFAGVMLAREVRGEERITCAKVVMVVIGIREALRGLERRRKG